MGWSRAEAGQRRRCFETQKHEWDLEKLVQIRWHKINDEWKFEKSRSIRRINIDRAPQDHFG